MAIWWLKVLLSTFLYWCSLYCLQLNVSVLPQVFEVEEEMRQLLKETETNKKIMEEKMKRLTSVLKDFNT